MKKKNAMQFLLLLVCITLSTAILQAQTTLTAPGKFSSVKGEINWATRPCSKVIPWVLDSTSGSIVKVYNFTVELREYKVSPTGLTKPEAGILIPGAKVSFGALIDSTRLPYKITGLTKPISEAFLVIKPAARVCNGCISCSCSVANVKVDMTNYLNVASTMVCKKP